MTTRPEYGPRHRIVAEVTKPRLVAMYMDGVSIEPETLDAHIATRQHGFDVEVTLDKIESVTGQKHYVGRTKDIEVVWVDE